jgi:predicted Rossmann fold flavoprotein
MMAELVRLRYYLGMHKNQFSDRLWDVVVVGGGPAGMMAAGRAAELGATVLLLEKNPSLGVKLLITGGGRCNVTNVEPDLRKLLARYKGSDQFLFSAFAQYDNHQVVKFFHSREMPIKVENEGRAFPVSNSARSVWEVLVDYLKQGGVEVRYNSTAKELISEGNLLTAVRLADGSQIKGKKFIVAAGGSSRPETGSTGDGFKWLKTLGLRVAPVSRALVPIALKDAWVKKLQGVSLADIKLTVLLDGEKQSVKKGKLLFTHVGISGPTVLNMSRAVGELLPYGEVVILLDLLPQFDHGQLKEKLHFLLTSESNKKIKNVLTELFPASFVSVILQEAKIDGETFSHSVRSEERVRLMMTVKNMILHVDCLLGEDKAIVSSGGVTLNEVDFKTMESKKVKGLYLVGDMLNIDRPSGGYSLQLCWSTGYVAGVSVNK